MPRYLIILFLALGFGSLHAQDNPIIEIKKYERTDSAIIINGIASVVPPNTKMWVTVQRINGKSIEKPHTIKTVEDVFIGSDGSFTATLKRYGSLNGFDFPAGKYQLEFYAGFSRAWQTVEVAKKAGVRLDEQGRSDLGEPRSLPKSSDLIAHNFAGEKVRFLQAVRTITIQAPNASTAAYKTGVDAQNDKLNQLTAEARTLMQAIQDELHKGDLLLKSNPSDRAIGEQTKRLGVLTNKVITAFRDSIPECASMGSAAWPFWWYGMVGRYNHGSAAVQDYATFRADYQKQLKRCKGVLKPS